jgi:hypothetical protein
MAMLCENQKTSQGQKNLYEHLNETLSTLCMFYPDEALQRLEEVSYLVKQ